MPANAAGMTALRITLVVLFTTFMLALQLPMVAEPWLPYGYTGLQLDDGQIVAVDPGSPAARAGVQAGDRIVFGSASWKTLILLGDFGLLPPNYPVAMSVERAGAAVPVHFITEPRLDRQSPLETLAAVASNAVYPVFALTGALLVLLRPSLMTRALFVFCLAYGTTIATVHWAFLPSAIFVPVSLFNGVFSGSFGDFPILLFVLLFPDYTLTGWRLRVATVVFAATALDLCLGIATQLLALTRPIPHLLDVLVLPGEVVWISAIAILAYTYASATVAERQRLKWAVLGMSFAFAAEVVNTWGSVLGAPRVLTNTANALTIVMPASLAYAILRHRLIDVRFALNRALLYTATTTVLFAMMGFLDWLTGKLVGDVHLSDAIEAAVAIGLGFVLNRVHQVLEGFVDRVLFRSRYRAETYLERVATSLPFATAERTVDETLVREPFDTLRLASAATFRLRDDGDYVRVGSAGWDSGVLRLDRDDPLVRFMVAERSDVWLEDVRRKVLGAPSGECAPVLAVPVISRNEVLAFTLYGLHADGTQLDPDEVRLLDRLARAAASAYDHVEVAALRQRLALQSA